MANSVKQIKRVIHPKEIDILRDIGYNIEGSFLSLLCLLSSSFYSLKLPKSYSGGEIVSFAAHKKVQRLSSFLFVLVVDL